MRWLFNKHKKYGCFALYHSTTNHLTYEDKIEQEDKIYILDIGDSKIVGNMLKISKLAEKYVSLNRLQYYFFSLSWKDCANFLSIT